MSRLFRPVFSYIYRLFKVSTTSSLPSYERVFGKDLLPGQVIVVIAAILLIRAYFKFGGTRPVHEEDYTARLNWKREGARQVFAAQNAHYIVQILLFLMALDTITSPVRSNFLLLLLFVSVGQVAIRRRDLEKATSYRSTMILHLAWGCQMVLLPAVWQSFTGDHEWEVVVIGVGGTIFSSWYIAGVMLLYDHKTERWLAEKKSDRTGNSDGEQEQENKKAGEPVVVFRGENTAARLVTVVDFVFLVLLQFV